jgi:chitin disaccharide deacetylase
MASLIINADDLGIHPDINRGIVEAFRFGILTSSSFMVTTPYFKETVTEAVLTTELPVGLHLSLSYGTAITAASRIPNLVDAEGRFTRTAATLIGKMPRETALYDQIRVELDAQIAIAREHGVKPTHLDSHQHVHMNPAIFRIVEDLSLRHGIPAIRMVREPFFLFELRHQLGSNLRRSNPLKLALLQHRARQIRPRVRTNDAFFGVMYSGNLGKPAFIAFLRAVMHDRGVWEVGIHPGHGPEPEAREPNGTPVHPFIASPWRGHELALLIDPEVKHLITQAGISLISFAGLASRPVHAP